MKKMVLFLSVFTLVSLCEAKTYFHNKSPYPVKFEFDNAGLSYDSGRYRDSMTPFSIQPGNDWGADTGLDWLKWVKLFVDYGNGKFEKVDERSATTADSPIGGGSWPVMESQVVVTTTTDGNGDIKPKLVINGV
jgi:hypothetical protein